MIYKFIDNNGTFVLNDPHKYNLYLPLTDRHGSILSSISPNLGGDIKRDNEHFLTPPVSIEDLRSNLLCRRDFFLKTPRKTIRLSYPYNDVMEAGFLYQKIIKKVYPFRVEITNFVPYDIGVEVMWVRVVNNSSRQIKITPTSFIPLYGRAEKNLRDHRHVSSLLNRIELDKYGIFLKPTMVFDEVGHEINKTNYFVLGFEGNGKVPLGQFPTLDYFYGEGNLISPDAVEKGLKPFKNKLTEFDGKEACAAFRFKDRVLKRSEEVNYFLIMGIEEDKRKIRDIFRRLNSFSKVRDSFQETKRYWLNYLNTLVLDFKDKDFNNWLLWVKLQPTLRKLFGCSFLPHFDYGKGGRGWRDLWQDALALLLSEPDKAKKLIFNNFKGVRIDGSNATIITKEGDFVSDRNRINRVWMDHGIWPYLTLRFYVHKTADLQMFLEDDVYFRDHLFKRASEIDREFNQKDFILRDRKNRIYKGSILEHLLVQNLVQFFNVGGHNIIRLEDADWNDGLDMASERGESVAFSFMYAHNLKDICIILEKLKEKKEHVLILKELSLLLDTLGEKVNYNDYRAKQKRLNEYLEKIKRIEGIKTKIKIDDLITDLKNKAQHLSLWLKNKEWLKEEGFFNGYYDNKARRVEGRKSDDSLRMLLTSQVFALMSGVADDSQVKKTWVSIQKYLKDKKLLGFRLNTKLDSIYLDLGRAFGFSYGDKENGAFFSHMVVMLANALYKRDRIKEGFEAINSIYKMATSPCAKINPMIPEYFNSEGRGLYHYLTGSASWYIYTLVEEILGIKFFFGDISLTPRLWRGNFFKPKIEAKFLNNGKTIKVVFIKEDNRDKTYQIKEVFCNKRRLPFNSAGWIIKKENLRNKENLIQVYLG